MSQLIVIVEVRPRLRIANVVLTSSDPLSQDLDLSCGSETICINDIIYEVPEVHFKPNTISGLLVTPHSATFRLETCNTVLENKFEVLDPLPLVPHLKLCKSNPQLSPSTRYKLVCSHCQSGCGHVGPGRILPRPSSGWKEGSSDWFCCAHKSAPPPSGCDTSNDTPTNGCDSQSKQQPCFVAGHSDLLWGPASFLVHRDCVRSECRDGVTGLLTCVGCQFEFGNVGCSGSGSENAKIWNYGVTFSEEVREGLENESDELSGGVENLNLSQHVGKFILEKTKTAGDTFERLVSSLVGESSSMMPKIMFSTKSEDLLCWVMDKNLCVYQNSLQTPFNPKHLKKINMLKILYKEKNETDDMKDVKNDLSVFTEVISEEMYLTGLNKLRLSVQNYPESMKIVQGYNVGYLKVVE